MFIIFICGGFWIVYLLSKATGESSNTSAFASYGSGLATAAVIAYMWSSQMGTRREGGDDDPVWGDSGEVVEEYKVSDKERRETGITVFLVVGAGVISGLYMGRKSRS